MRHSHANPSLNSPCVSRITTPATPTWPGLAPLPGGRSWLPRSTSRMKPSLGNRVRRTEQSERSVARGMAASQTEGASGSQEQPWTRNHRSYTANEGWRDSPRSLGRANGRTDPYPRNLAQIPLPRRELRDLVSEELRRLDSDEVYAEALAELKKGLGEPTKGVALCGLPRRPRSPFR